MSDVPDDLTTEGTHRGGDPPEDTGRTVRAPDGPDDGAKDARTTPARFQLMKHKDALRYRVRAFPPRTVVSDADDGYTEVDQFTHPDDLREALVDLPDATFTIVFEDPDADAPFVERTTSATHPWLGKPQYDVATLFTDPEAAQAYAERGGSDR